ncbi:MAG: hypothetical protein OEV06_07875, partial [Anaerolineae bacterium]|nr:hypothetical protein [Anaerolineae bacterium]
MRSNNTVFFLFIILVVVGLAACSPSVERLPPAEAASPVPSLSLSTPTASPALLDAATAESDTTNASEPACDLSPALTDQDGILHTSPDGAFALSLSAD